MNPPIRTKDHYEKLWHAVNSSLVSIIGSDHAPHTKEEKNKNILHLLLACLEYRHYYLLC
jgi:dihydroorotase-like cyclic amidohydrolase